MARVASAILNTSYSDRPQRNRRRSMSRRAGLMMRSERNCRNWSGVQDVWPWVYRPTVVLKRGSAKRTDKSGTTRPTTSSFHLRYRKAASIGVSFRARTLHYARLSPKSGHPRPKPYPRQKKRPRRKAGSGSSWSGRRDSNPRIQAWEAWALPLGDARMREGNYSAPFPIREETHISTWLIGLPAEGAEGDFSQPPPTPTRRD